jgi:hypothetical protein
MRLYAQEIGGHKLFSNIFGLLKIEKMYYDSIDEIIIQLSDRNSILSMTAHQYPNKYHINMVDVYYSLYFPEYILTIYKSALLPSYNIYSIEITKEKNESVFQLLPYSSKGKYLSDNNFGKMVESMSTSEILVYSIIDGYRYLFLYFDENDIVNKILICLVYD